MGWRIDMELKGCESIECWTHVVTFNVHLTHDLDLGFSRSKAITWTSDDLSYWRIYASLYELINKIFLFLQFKKNLEVYNDYV